NPRFPSFRCQRHGAISRFLHRPGRVRVWINRVEVKKAAKDGESRPGESEVWIKLDRFSVVARGLLLGPRELGVELLRDRAGDFAFHAEDVIEFTIVAFGPEMFVGRDTN